MGGGVAGDFKNCHQHDRSSSYSNSRDGKDALFNALKYLKLSAKNSEDIVCIVSELGSDYETIEVQGVGFEQFDEAVANLRNSYLCVEPILEEMEPNHDYYSTKDG